MNCKKSHKKEYDRLRYEIKRELKLKEGWVPGKNNWTVSHRMTGSKEYASWQAMKRRCANPSDKSWPEYGGRGISVCEEWMSSFEAFYRDMGACPDGSSIDRIKNDLGYFKGNCRWASKLEQTRNRRCTRLVDCGGELFHLIDLCQVFGASYSTVHSRIYKHGWTVREALAMPKGSRLRPIRPPSKSTDTTEVKELEAVK